MSEHPIDSVEWVDPRSLTANDYNPNKVFRPELDLLKHSLLTDGWTTPIYARRDGEIIDGFHRWSLHCPDSPLYDEELAEATDGKVPVVYPREGVSEAELRGSTVRHNRARGKHGVLKMSDILHDLVDERGVDPERVRVMLGMDKDEFERLYATAGMPERGGDEEFAEAWVPG